MAQPATVCPRTGEACSWRVASAAVMDDFAWTIPAEQGGWSFIRTLGRVFELFDPQQVTGNSKFGDHEGAKSIYCELDRIMTVNCVRSEECIVQDALKALPDLMAMVEAKQQNTH